MKSPISITVSSVSDRDGTAEIYTNLNSPYLFNNNKDKDMRYNQHISAKDISIISKKRTNSVSSLCVMPTSPTSTLRGDGGRRGSSNDAMSYLHNRNQNENQLLPLSRSHSSPGISAPHFLDKQFLQVPKVYTTAQHQDASVKMYKTNIVSMRTKDKIGDNNHVTYYPNRKLSDSWIGSIDVVDKNLLKAKNNDDDGYNKTTVRDNFKKSKEKDKSNSSSSSSSLLGTGKGSFRRSKNKVKNLVTNINNNNNNNNNNIIINNNTKNNSKSSSGFSRGSFRKNKDSSSKSKSTSSLSPTSPKQPSVTMETIATAATPTQHSTMSTTHQSSGDRGSFRRPKLNLKISSKSNKVKDLNNNNINNNNKNNKLQPNPIGEFTSTDKIPKINIEHENNNNDNNNTNIDSCYSSRNNLDLLTKQTVLMDKSSSNNSNNNTPTNHDFRLRETEIRAMIQDFFNQQLEGVNYQHHINELSLIHI